MAYMSGSSAPICTRPRPLFSSRAYTIFALHIVVVLARDGQELVLPALLRRQELDITQLAVDTHG
jgi:hypothetical protein